MRHLKTKEWVQIFDLYNKYLNLTITKAEFENYCFDIRKEYWNKESLRNMLKKRKLYNLNMNIESQSGKLPKKDKGVGRKKKKVLAYTWIDTLKDYEKDAVIKYYYRYRIFNENNIDADIKNIKEIENLSSKKESKHFLIARSTYYEKLKDNHKAKELKIKNKEIIFQSFVENKESYGRRKLAKYIFQEYNIDINPEP